MKEQPVGQLRLLEKVCEARVRHARDQLLFEVGVMDFNTYGGDITFRITRPVDGSLVAMAKSGFVFFNYKLGKVVPMPTSFSDKFSKINWLNPT